MNNFWSTLAAALLSALTGLLGTFINPLLDRVKILPLLSGVFAAVDPVIKQNLPEMSNSDIYQAFRYAAIAVSDGKLSESEINRLTALALQKFDIRIAANNGVIPQMEPAKLEANVNAAIADFKQQQAALAVKPVSGAAALGIVSISRDGATAAVN